ncbi:hypothetical protein AWM70_20150 [Paenibacillus yonginensis]|uniref:Polysaccharide biosynthesis protein n=1 Tax=Paenibacillus yonginensis TaxID=1462996 RepID=A0A1B1N592_9BACL|nr:oligosaccharide flippase family protein [Paenibacillus yonginensis]ANS76603.1 hypothetical protein AWM70_20150 [Paenibacillus yonginensis]
MADRAKVRMTSRRSAREIVRGSTRRIAGITATLTGRRKSTRLTACLKRLPIDRFIRNVAVLAGGTLLSQILIFAALPLLTRLYTPEEYGTFSMYVSMIGMLLMLVSFAYEYAITLPEDDRTASEIVRLCLLICVAVSLLVFAAMAVLRRPLGRWLNEPDLPNYFVLFAVSLLASGFYQILSTWAVRKQYFRRLSRTKYTQSIGQIGGQLAFSLLHPGPVGLIAGDIAGRSGGLLPLWRQWRRDHAASQGTEQEVSQAGGLTPGRLAGQTADSQAALTDSGTAAFMVFMQRRLGWSRLKEVAWRYRRFPQLSLASNVLNSIGIYLPTVLLAAFYGTSAAGLFALGQRILGAPMTLLVSAVRSVYLAESSAYMQTDPSRLVPLFRRTVLQMLAAGAAILILFVGIAPFVFAPLFGEEWSGSAGYIRLMSVMYLGQFVANAVGTTIDVMERQDLHLLREIIRTVMILGAILGARYSGQDAGTAVLLFSAASTAGYILHLVLSWWSIRKYGVLKAGPKSDESLPGPAEGLQGGGD